MRKVKSFAKREGISVAQVVREALMAYISGTGSQGKVPSIAGKFFSDHPDTASRADDLLWQDPHA